MDQAQVVVDRLVTAINMAQHNGVDITDLAGKLSDGQLSEHETAQLRAHVAKHIQARDLGARAAQARLMADNMVSTAQAARAEADDNPQSATLETIASDLESRLDRLEAQATRLEAELAA